MTAVSYTHLDVYKRQVCTDAGVPFERRLDQVYTGVREVIERTKPEVLAIEKLFYQHNQTTVIGAVSYTHLLIKNIFNSAEESKVIKENPSKTICARGGKPAKRREALTDEQTAILLDSIRELPPYVFVMIGLYAGLRREEILGLKWDCVFLDEKTPYISVRRAWHVEGGEPVVNTLLKTPAAKRDVPIPKCLVACLKEEREKSESEYVISNSKGTVLTETQFVRVWKYITVRSTAERCYYTYVNGQSIKHRIKPRLGAVSYTHLMSDLSTLTAVGNKVDTKIHNCVWDVRRFILLTNLVID